MRRVCQAQNTHLALWFNLNIGGRNVQEIQQISHFGKARLFLHSVFASSPWSVWQAQAQGQIDKRTCTHTLNVHRYTQTHTHSLCTDTHKHTHTFKHVSKTKSNIYQIQGKVRKEWNVASTVNFMQNLLKRMFFVLHVSSSSFQPRGGTLKLAPAQWGVPMCTSPGIFSKNKLPLRIHVRYCACNQPIIDQASPNGMSLPAVCTQTV